MQVNNNNNNNNNNNVNNNQLLLLLLPLLLLLSRTPFRYNKDTLDDFYLSNFIADLK